MNEAKMHAVALRQCAELTATEMHDNARAVIHVVEHAADYLERATEGVTPFAWHWLDSTGCMYLSPNRPDVPKDASPLYEHPALVTTAEFNAEAAAETIKVLRDVSSDTEIVALVDPEYGEVADLTMSAAQLIGVLQLANPPIPPVTTPSVAMKALEFYANPCNWIDTPPWDGDPECITEKAIPVTDDGDGSRPCDCGDTAKAALSAISAQVQPAALPVKPLNWQVFCSRSGNSSAKTMFGEYVVQDDGECWRLWLPTSGDDPEPMRYSSRDAAQAAGQSWHDNAVRGMLA